MIVKSNGAFLKRIEERKQKWAGLQEIAARIRVSEALKWWVYQEYGTLQAKIEPKPDPLGVYRGLADIWRLHAASLHSTDPKTGKEYLFAKVPAGHWRGTKPKHMVENAMEKINEAVHLRIQAAIKQGLWDHPEMLDDVVISATQDAKEIIREAFREQLSDAVRSDGQLKGATAEEAFEEDAKVERVK